MSAPGIDPELSTAIDAALAAWRNVPFPLEGLDEAMEAIEDLLDAREMTAWKTDPRRYSIHPAERAAWVFDDPAHDRRRSVGEHDDGEAMATDGWGMLAWHGESVPGESIDPIPARLWRRVLRQEVGPAAFPERVTATSDGKSYRAYRIGPGIYDADRVEEWVPDLTVPALAPIQDSEPAMWRGGDWTACVMPLRRDALTVADGWPGSER